MKAPLEVSVGSYRRGLKASLMGQARSHWKAPEAPPMRATSEVNRKTLEARKGIGGLSL